MLPPRYGYLLSALRSIGWGCLLVLAADVAGGLAGGDPPSIYPVLGWGAALVVPISAVLTLRRPAALLWGVAGGGLMVAVMFIAGSNNQDPGVSAELLMTPAYVLMQLSVLLMPLCAGMVLLPLVCPRPGPQAPWGRAALLGGAGVAVTIACLALLTASGGPVLFPIMAATAAAAYLGIWWQARRQAAGGQEGVG